MTILRPNPVALSQFTWDRSANLLVAEMSSLDGFGRVFDDACDEGLTIISHHTGREVVYAVMAEEKDVEGDLLFWDLESARLGEDVPKVRIFND